MLLLKIYLRVSLLENEGLKLIYGGQTYIFDFKDGENAQIKLGEYTITATKGSRNTININIPQGLTSTSDLKEFVFEVKVKIDENFDRWESENYTYKAIFKNSIIVKVDNQEWKDTQTQTITKDYIEDENVLGKQVGNFENNIIPYSIVVNKEGADLLEGSDILTLKDELKYGEWLWLQHQVDIKFVYESFHVYKYDNGIKGEEIDVKYTFNKETIPGTIFNKLSIEVPDEQPLLVEYKYEISGNYQWNIDVLNDVVLEGEHFDSNISKGQITVQIVDSSAGATLNGINIYKVDSSNYSNLLPGAEFELYRWDGSAYVKEKTFTIDESGKFAIEDIVYNTAYKLVETKAPEGYILKTEPFYFYVVKTGEPITKPNDFNGVEYKAGNDIYFENKMDGTEITVNKKWFDSNGDVVIGEDNLGEVKFKLWRKEKDDTTGATKELYRQESYTLSSENKWKITIGSLPKTGVNSSGETVEYLYYVEEDGDVLNYETSYENNDGVITGTITIKNTQIKNPEYELPETGMFGGKGLFILGGLLMLAGSLYIYRQKHKGDMSK